MKGWMWLAALSVTSTAAVPIASTARADEFKEHETRVSIDLIPAPAHDALTREAGGSPIIDVVRETDDGQTVYEAHVREGDDIVGIEVDENGKLVKREKEGTFNEPPK